MSVEFVKLNRDWNADPNAPHESVISQGQDVVMEFCVNSWTYPGFREGERAGLRFYSCSKYRLGPTNDEGWHAGQCRFGKLAPAWGDFYQVSGEGYPASDVTDWVEVTESQSNNHYLFYLRDSTFECFAQGYEFIRGPDS